MKKRGPDKFEVAVEFVNLSPDIRDKISFFILNKERELIRKKRLS